MIDVAVHKHVQDRRSKTGLPVTGDNYTDRFDHKDGSAPCHH